MQRTVVLLVAITASILMEGSPTQILSYAPHSSAGNETAPQAEAWDIEPAQGNELLDEQQVYQVSEFPVKVAAADQGAPAISGNWVVWNDGSPEKTQQIIGRNLETGLEFTIPAGGGVLSVDVGGDAVVTAESNFDPAAPQRLSYGVFGYRLPDGQRFTIVPFSDDEIGGPVRTDGKTAVWVQRTVGGYEVLAYDLAGQRLYAVSSGSAFKVFPTVSGNTIAWTDRRHTSETATESDQYWYDISTGQEFRITPASEVGGAPAVSNGIVVWPAVREGATYVLGYDVARRQELNIAQVAPDSGPVSADIDGGIVVWNSRGESDQDIYGYDLKQRRQFTISSALGDQTDPRISGNTVAWTDFRRSGVGKYERDADVIGARLEPGRAPAPPAIGVPSSADAKIEIVWPHGGAPADKADRVNISAWLFQPGTLKPAPCQWSPKAQLWRAVNDEPARLVAVSQKYGGIHYANGRAVPTWEFNDIDVSPARDPKNKLYFYVTLEGVPGRTNVWAHGLDARTFFPQQDVPGGIAPVTASVDAKIEIVWPHDNAPVDQARQVNVTAALFAPGTLLAVAPDWNPTVLLHRALNNGVSQEVATGKKRLVGSPRGLYSVWDFNDIDVSAANDLANKYYFTISVDGVRTATNVWVHGADARTYFPQVDTPVGDCRSGPLD